MMAMVDFPRRGLDGKDYSQKDIEDAFVGNLENEIRDEEGTLIESFETTKEPKIKENKNKIN